MSFIVYANEHHHQDPDAVAVDPTHDLHRPDTYLADRKLVDALNVAMLLDQPLLLTGEVGSGKTQFAHHLAWQMDMPPPLVFTAQPTSLTRDLFYTYDAKRHYDAARQNGVSRPLDFLHYHALGLAILLANDEQRIHRYLPPDFDHNGRRRTVVLIDDINHANDSFTANLPDVIEKMAFRVRELQSDLIQADKDYRPLVIIASNLTKPPPEALLGSCTHHHLAFPDRKRLKEITQSRLGDQAGVDLPLHDHAQAFFFDLRSEQRLEQAPSTHEYLNWYAQLRQSFANNPRVFLQQPDEVEQTLGWLAHSVQERRRISDYFNEWLLMSRLP